MNNPWIAAILNIPPFGLGYLYLLRPMWFFVAIFSYITAVGMMFAALVLTGCAWTGSCNDFQFDLGQTLGIVGALSVPVLLVFHVVKAWLIARSARR